MNKNKTNRAFTLLELLVVISIISLLTSVILVTVNSVQAKGRDSKRTQDMVQLRSALELRSLSNNGKYPSVPNGTNIYFTSMGPVQVANGEKPKCPATGTNWTDYDINGAAAAFVDDMDEYIPQLPKDPKNNSDHCYVYVAQDTVGGSDIGAFYAWQEAPVLGYGVGATDDGYTLGVIAGNNSYYDNNYWEDINNIIGLNAPQSGNQSGNQSGGNQAATITSVIQSQTLQGGFGVYGSSAVSGSGFDQVNNVVEIFGVNGTYTLQSTVVNSTLIRFSLPGGRNFSRRVDVTYDSNNQVVFPPGTTQDMYTLRVQAPNGSWSNTIQFGVLTFGNTPEGATYQQQTFSGYNY